jgi:cell division protease FtsH
MLEMKSDRDRPKRVSLLWWVVLLALLLWNLASLWPRGQTEAELTYSAFIDQVEQDHVASVIIQESEIRGEFTEPLTLPDKDLANVIMLPTPSPTGEATSAAPISYTSFKTNFPESVGDPQLLSMLQDHHVAIQAEPPSTPWFTVLLTNGLPILLMLGVLYWMGRQVTKNQSGIFNFGQSKARRYEENLVEVTFEDVAGADEAKRDLQEVVDFLQHPKRYHDLGARIPRGVLLVGPPGTGKTLMARAVAGEAGVPFFSLSASEFVEMFVGVGASRVRDLFQRAKTAAPAIVFIDELDAVGRRRGTGLGTVNDEREQTLNQLLVEMDGFDEHHELILMAATNRPDVLDPALLRPGRFDRRIVVNLPDRTGREGILRIHTREIPLSDDVDLDLLARTTTGFNGADLANLCNESALIAARNGHEKVMMKDFEEAVDKVLLGGVRPLLLDAHERKVVAYHEAGHALIAWYTPLADPVHKVTIIPRGQALGVTEQVPGEDHYNYSRGYLLARLAVMLGGRMSEELVLGEPTTGAENDLVEATRLARRMATRWGMGTLGEMAFVNNEEQPFLGYELAQTREYSEETAAHIDRDVQDLLHERVVYVRQCLEANRDKLDELADVLLQEETIGQNELKNILGSRPVDGQQVGLVERHTHSVTPQENHFVCIKGDIP